MKKASTTSISTTLTAKRLDVTETTVRRWCKEGGFGVRLMGRWRIPETRVAEIERNLRGEGPPVALRKNSNG